MRTMEERFRAKIHEVLNDRGPDAFACWFYSGAGEKIDSQYAFRSGFKDFFRSVMREPTFKYLRDPEEKVALEIGYGGGRLIHAAAHMFKTVLGVDIHYHRDIVNEMLLTRGIDNVELYETDGKSLPILAQSVDFVYSFIVFIHLSSPQVLEKYIQESYRVLKPGGIASFYYGRPYSRRTRKSQNALTKKFYSLVELLAEFCLLDLSRGGYRTFPEVEANNVSLMVTRRRMRHLVRREGFMILSQQSNENWSQGFIVLQKR